MSGGSSESSSGSFDLQDQAFKDLRGPIADIFRNLFGQFGGDLGAGFEGPLVAPVSFEEQQLLGRFESGGELDQLTEGQKAAAKHRLATISGENLDQTEQFEPFARAIREQFEEAQLESVGKFTQAGQRVQESSPFARASAITSRGLSDALSRTAADIFKTERGFQEQAAAGEEAQTAARAQANAAKAEALTARLSAVALPRLVADLGLERGQEEFARRMEVLLNLFGLSVQATQVVVAGFGSASSAEGGI